MVQDRNVCGLDMDQLASPPLGVTVGRSPSCAAKSWLRSSYSCLPASLFSAKAGVRFLCGSRLLVGSVLTFRTRSNG
jgi:hypothetical protein